MDTGIVFSISSVLRDELTFITSKCASGSGVEYNLAKVGVAGPSPVFRSFSLIIIFSEN